jgi:type I restriction enzyme S subunit
MSSSMGKAEMQRLQVGGGKGNLNTGDLKKYYFAIPPTIAEQSAIATVLSDIDRLIKALTKLIDKKKSIKQGAMQELLTGKKRLEGFSGEWVKSTLQDCAKIVRGASPRPIDDTKWFDAKSKIGWVRISDVSKSNKYLYNTTQKLSQLGIQNSRFVSRDNLIMSICATLGRPIITKINVCIHDGFVVFNDLQVEVEFLYYFLQAYENEWSKQGQTGSQMNLNTGLINNTFIMIPPTLTEQTAIATILTDMDIEIEKLNQKLNKYKGIKQGMMQELLTGRIRLVEGVVQ